MNHAELIARMTLEQKCALLSGAGSFSTRAYPGLGIPALEFSDGPHGVRRQAGESDHLGLSPSAPATCFPTACTVACSWDARLAERVGAALGEEAASQGVGCLLGPGLNIKRSPLCGRNFEYFSEDPLVSGVMAAAYVRGIQGAGIAACPKHLAANSQELRRMASDSEVDERTLRELYLAGFETCVRTARPRAIMSSYNMVNGTYANESPWLLGEVLRGEWGFDGAVVTDWGGSNDHVAGVAAGSTFEMPAPGGDSVRELARAVRRGRLDESVLDARVAEALDLVLGTAPALDAARGRGFDTDAHHALAREAAAEGAVLLKNEGALLPLSPETRVALIGDFAERPRYQGAGSSAVNATREDSLASLAKAEGLAVVGYEPGFERSGTAGADAVELRRRAVDLAGRAKVAIVCLGLTEAQESEGVDRRGLALPPGQVELLRAVSATGVRVVALLHAGSAVETPWRDACDALVLLGLGGQAGAGGALDVLCGRVNPAGKLAESWPERLGDTPCAPTFPATGRVAAYREGPYVGYRYYRTAGVPVAFPFGFGLSYTSFSYSDASLELSDDAMPVAVSFTLANTGGLAGAEVAQLYVAPPRREVFGPEEQLAGFARVELGAGESRRVRIGLCEHALAYWNVRTHGWEVEGGTYELRVAASSEDVRLVVRAQVASSGAASPYAGTDMGPYQTGRVAGVTNAQFERLLGRPLPNDAARIDRTMTLCELRHTRSPLAWLAAAALDRAARRAEASGSADLNVTFVRNMPLRAIAKMTGGAVSMGMVDGIVWELRGAWLVGVGRVIVGAVANAVGNARLRRRLAAADRAQRRGGEA